MSAPDSDSGVFVEPSMDSRFGCLWISLLAKNTIGKRGIDRQCSYEITVIQFKEQVRIIMLVDKLVGKMTVLGCSKITAEIERMSEYKAGFATSTRFSTTEDAYSNVCAVFEARSEPRIVLLGLLAGVMKRLVPAWKH